MSATVEIAGMAMFGNGLTSQLRPKRYFTIPRDSLERFLDDVEQLINFFVIETQRIVFAENIYTTSTVSRHNIKPKRKINSYSGIRGSFRVLLVD